MFQEHVKSNRFLENADVQLSRKGRSGTNNLKKINTQRCKEQAQTKKTKGRTSLVANSLWDEHGQMSKVVCIIALIECKSG